MVDSLPVFLALPETLTGKSGDVDTLSLMDNDIVGFYFSAHWCPPCRGFTPILADAYKEWKNEGKKVEIVFVSSDRDIDEFNDYYKTMPWLAISLNQTEAIGYLKQLYSVSGIPKLVIVNGVSGAIIDDNARTTVTNNPVGAAEEWIKKIK